MAHPLHIPVGRRVSGVRVLGSTAAAAGGDAGAPAAPTPEQIEQAVQERLGPEVQALRQARGALEQGLGQVRQLGEQVRKQAEDHVLALALEIARKVLMQTVEAGQYEVEPIVRAALERLPGRGDVTVHLHPDDLARCELAQPAEGGEAGPGAGVRFVSDPAVPPAGCRVASGQGTVASDVQTSFAAVAAALTGNE